jgi:hypothetical protein
MIPAFAPQFRDFPAELGVNPIDVVFVGTPEEKELNMAAANIKAAAEAAASVMVKVVAPYRVTTHDGKHYVGGDVVEVPNDIADTWIKAKWAEPVSEKEK